MEYNLGSVEILSFNVTNGGNIYETISLHSLNSDINEEYVDFTYDSMTLSPGTPLILMMTFDAPQIYSISPGIKKISVELFCSEENDIKNILIELNVLEYQDLSASLNTTDITLYLEKETHLLLEISNQGNAMDIFDIELLANNSQFQPWINLSNSSLNLKSLNLKSPMLPV